MRDRRRQLHLSMAPTSDGCDSPRSTPRPTRSSASVRSWHSAHPTHSVGARSTRAFEAGACDEDIVATLIQRRDDHWRCPGRPRGSGNRVAASDTTSTAPSRADRAVERHPNRMTIASITDSAKPSSAQDDRRAAQADHRWQACGRGEWHVGIRRAARSERACFASIAGGLAPFAPRSRAPSQPAHRVGVRAVRGERSIPRGDPERSERGGRCLRTTSPRCIHRLPRHVTDRLPASRGAARGATQAARRSVRTRSP